MDSRVWRGVAALATAVAVGQAIAGWRRAGSEPPAVAPEPVRLTPRERLEAVAGKALAGLADDASTGSHHGVVVAVLDVDDFHGLNQLVGPQRGDALLARIESRLSEAAGDAAIVAGLGGDTFGVVWHQPMSARQAARAAKTLLAAVSGDEVYADDVRLDLRATVGVALSPYDGEDFSSLLRAADLAMHHGKRSKEPICFHVEARNRDDMGTAGALSLLRSAMDNGQMELHYQPLVDARDGVTRTVEALIRWNHPGRGMVYPDHFIPMVERTTLIHPLTRWVMLTAIGQAAAWRAEGIDLRVAVNTSAVSLDTGLLGIVQEALTLHHWPADRLVLEITESAVMVQPEISGQVVSSLRQMGVIVSVDDFGAGYTSLRLLTELPVHELKIDRQFVNLLAEGQDAVAATILELGHRLGFSVIAEGVETAETAACLIAMGCDQLQGYYFARPMPAAEIPGWLAGPGSHALDGVRLGPPPSAG